MTKDNTVFAKGCGFYKIVWLFMIGAFCGDIIETVFCRFSMGRWMSRSSVVWGHFSIVWGGAIALASVLLYKYRKRSAGFLFLCGCGIGGVFEYVASVFTELVFGTVFWDYSKIPLNINGRVNVLFCAFWGIACVVWFKVLYPLISGKIERIPINTGKVLTWGMVLFMSLNMVVSSMALIRNEQRKQGEPAVYRWQEIMDKRFDDNRLKQIYPSAIKVI